MTTINYNDDVVLYDHVKAVLDALQRDCPFQIGEWERPKDANEKFIDPPYAIVRLFPSTGQFQGDFANFQRDITLRIQVMGVGFTQLQAITVIDITRKHMYRENLVIPNRYIQMLKFMVSSGGVARDDDLPTPLLSAYDVYELRTTPET